MINKFKKILTAFLITACAATGSFAVVKHVADLPQDFVYVKDVDSSIVEDMRYATSRNFTGRSVIGYKKPRAILTREAAEALSRVQKELLSEGYSLVIYDAYRPEKSEKALLVWAAKKSSFVDVKVRNQYYPRIARESLSKLGYLADMSPNSRGSSVSVTIIPVAQQHKVFELSSTVTRQLEDQSRISYMDDGTVDMGSGFDLFDEASAHDSKVIASQYLEHRDYLRKKMKKHGFKSNPMAWWHYTLENEPFPNTYFDFDVQ